MENFIFCEVFVHGAPRPSLFQLTMILHTSLRIIRPALNRRISMGVFQVQMIQAIQMIPNCAKCLVYKTYILVVI